jgi:hypothetical protein
MRRAIRVCLAIAVVLMVVVPAAAEAHPLPTLGLPATPPGQGFGEIEPEFIGLGADATGLVHEIHWRAWGAPQAIGRGNGLYLPPHVYNTAYGRPARARVVAWDLGYCHGQWTYRRLEWYFPQFHRHGHFPPATYLDRRHAIRACDLGDERTARRQATGLPVLEWGSGAAVRPPTFVGWSGDGSFVLGGPSTEPPLPNQAGGSAGRIEWMVWNHSIAIGRGVVWYDDCDPDCGTGHWHSEPPTRVKAYRVRGGQFTRLRAELGMGPRRHWYVFGYENPYPPQWEKLSG